MALGIFGQLDWLTKKFKALCCLIEKNAAQQQAYQEANPCYLEVITDGREGGALELSDINTRWISGSGEPFTNLIKIITGNCNIYRLYGGKNITTSYEPFNKYVISINDGCGAITSVGPNTFEIAPLTYANLPNVQTLGERAFSGVSLTSLSLPKVTTLIGIEVFRDCLYIVTLNLPLCTNLGPNGSCVNDYQFSGLPVITTLNIASINATSCAGGPDANILALMGSNPGITINYV